MKIPLGELLPDRADVGLQGLSVVENLQPTAEGYNTFPSLQQLDTLPALDSVVRGANRGRMNERDFVVAGDETKLYLSLDTVTWISLSLPFNVPVRGKWVFEQYTTKSPFTKKDLVLATNGVDEPYKMDISIAVPVWTVIDPHVSLAKVSGIVRDFYVLGDVTGRGNNVAIGREEAGLHWSARGNPEGWPTIGTQAATDALSDVHVFPGDGGPVTAIVQVGEFGLVFRERQTWRMDYVGLPDVWSFRLLDDHRGCVVPDGAIAVGGLCYFPSEEGFLACNGSSIQEIGAEKIDRTWDAEINKDRLDRASVAHDPRTRGVYWAFPTGDSSTPDKVYGFIYTVSRWTTLVDSTLEWLLTVFATADSLSIIMDIPTIDDADMDDVIGPIDLIADPATGMGLVVMDTLTANVFSESLGAFRTDHLLYTYTGAVHQLGKIETGNISNPNELRITLKSVLPLVSVGSADSAIKLQMFSGILPQEMVASARGALAMNRLGKIPYRVSGKYLRAAFTTVGTVEQFTGFEADLAEGGAR